MKAQKDGPSLYDVCDPVLEDGAREPGPARVAAAGRLAGIARRDAIAGTRTDPRAHIRYLPELYCAYFGRCYAAFIALPLTALQASDPHDDFGVIRGKVLGYVDNELIAGEMNVFDAARRGSVCSPIIVSFIALS
jgi:hypothetical protein